MSDQSKLPDGLVARLRSAATDLCSPDGCCYDETMTAAADEIGRLQKQLVKAVTALQASLGYLKNAEIDLSTGATKKTAQNTIRGGIGLIETALSDIGSTAALTDDQGTGQ